MLYIIFPVRQVWHFYNLLSHETIDRAQEMPTNKWPCGIWFYFWLTFMVEVNCCAHKCELCVFIIEPIMVLQWYVTEVIVRTNSHWKQNSFNFRTNILKHDISTHNQLYLKENGRIDWMPECYRNTNGSIFSIYFSSDLFFGKNLVVNWLRMGKIKFSKTQNKQKERFMCIVQTTNHTYVNCCMYLLLTYVRIFI